MAARPIRQTVVKIIASLYALVCLGLVVWGIAYVVHADRPDALMVREGPYDVSGVSYVSGGIHGPSTILHLTDGSTMVISGHRSLPAIGKLFVVRRAAGIHAGCFVRFERLETIQRQRDAQGCLRR